MFSEMSEQSQDQSQNVSHVDFGCHKAYSVTAMPKALQVDWTPIRSAVESGLPYAKVSQIFGIPEQTLRKQASRNRWITNTVVQKLTDSGETAAVTNQSHEAIRAAITETWAEKGAKLRRVMFRKAFNAVKQSSVQTPKNWRDLEIADKLARRAAGLDTADNQVILSFSLPGWGQNARVFDADSGAYSGPSSEEETQSPPTAIEDSGGD